MTLDPPGPSISSCLARALAVSFALGLLASFSNAAFAQEADLSRGGVKAQEVRGEERSRTDPITRANVYDRESDWPNIVAITRSWTPTGDSDALRVGYRGALVRVNADGNPRIDFGRHGQHDVPVDHTDLVDAANGVRLGTVHKTAPNFLLQVGTRLVVGKEGQVRALRSAELAQAKLFLCVFADPGTTEFRAVVDRLSEFESAGQLEMIFFPQSVERGELGSLVSRLEELSWSVPFSYPHLSENYTTSLLGASPALPTFLLVTSEGRVLYRSTPGVPLDADRLRDLLAG